MLFCLRSVTTLGVRIPKNCWQEQLRGNFTQSHDFRDDEEAKTRNEAYEGLFRWSLHDRKITASNRNNT